MLRWLIWTTVVIVWTVGLELRVPHPGDTPTGEFIYTNRYAFGKCLHIAVYGALTVLSAWVPIAGRSRWLMMIFLMAHAWGTEMLQEALNPWCHRDGSLGDVGIDYIGIAIGLAASWKWWTRKESNGDD